MTSKNLANAVPVSITNTQVNDSWESPLVYSYIHLEPVIQQSPIQVSW